jgi:tripartite-type tricarboxylate transporter receptor subunit TctC
MSDTTSADHVSVLFLTKQPAWNTCALCGIVAAAMHRSRRTVLSLPLVLALGRHAQAESWPTHAIRFNVPWPAGGVADTVARVTADKLSERLGQKLIVENRPGASGNIGMAAVAAAPADGYTLVLTPTGNLTVNPALYKDLPFDTAKANPGKLTFASPGQGSGAHLAGELLKADAGIDMLHVPYTGIAPAMNDVVGERVSLMFLGISSALPYIRAGTLRPLAVAALKKSPLLPDVPLVADEGYPGFDVTSWYGVAVRSGTPADIVDRLYRETAEVLKLDDVKERFAGMGVEPGGLPPQEFAAMVRSETKKWGDIIVRANIKLE